MTPAVALLVVAGAWWLGTGLVFAVAYAGRGVRSIVFGLATVAMLPVLAGLRALSVRTDSMGVVLALLAGFALWAWVELSFYTGFVTGPGRRPPPAGAGFGVRLRHAFMACLWHELAVIVLLGVIAWLSPGPNRWALAQFGVFWGLHEVARLNVLAGVPHPFRELLPRHLASLQCYMEPRAAGPLLPATIAGLALATIAAGALAFVGDAGAGARIGWTSVTVLLGIGVVEHAVLLFPVPLARIWRWFGVGAAASTDPAR